MLIPSFTFKTPKAIVRERPKKVICRNVEGLIVKGILPCRYDISIEVKNYPELKEIYSCEIATIPFSDDSYDCKYKSDIWTENKKSKTGWIHIVRENIKYKLQSLPEMYLPFRPNYAAVGNIIKVNGELQFKLIACKPPVNGNVLIYDCNT